jgi:hypothetical protein
VDDLIDLVIIHQGIINPYDPVPSQGIIISLHRSDIMSISEALKEVVEDIGARGDEDIDQLHLDHIADHPSHPARDHGSGQSQKDDTGGIAQHLLKHLKTFEEIPALERGVLEGLHQIVKTLRLFHIERANGMVEKGRFPSFFHRLNTLWGRLIVAEINRLKKISQEKTTLVKKPPL